MAFNGINLTPIGGNSRSGIDLAQNAPMGWGYASEVDSSDDIFTAGYFDSINKIVGANQFIYCALTDINIIVTIESVDRLLQQVTLAAEFIQPILEPQPIFTGVSWDSATTDVDTLGKHRLYTYTGSTATTFTLPSTHDGTDTHPWYFEIKDETGDASANPITVAAAILIDGVASLQITAGYGLLRLYANAGGYFTR